MTTEIEEGYRFPSRICRRCHSVFDANTNAFDYCYVCLTFIATRFWALTEFLEVTAERYTDRSNNYLASHAMKTIREVVDFRENVRNGEI